MDPDEAGPVGADEVAATLPPPLPVGVQLTDAQVVAAAVTIAVGAWLHRPVPLVVLGTVGLLAVVSRRPAVLMVAVLVLASWLGARSWSGLEPMGRRPFSGVVTLVADPSPSPFGWRADVRLDGHRVELSAAQGAGGSLSRALAGEQVAVVGHLGPPPDPAPWLVPRHVVGRLDASSVQVVGSGAAPWRAANRFRRLLAAGAQAMSPTTRSLYAGFVLGDDRDQAPAIVDDFRGSGLTHLLVVSGQNVAFVLVVAAPLVDRLGWRGRWLVTMAVIVGFGVVTRFEPSVLRASAMAAVAVTGGALGRPTRAVRTLSIAVGGLLLVDPLLVRSVGFQLSVGASLAIAVFARSIADALPGPRPVAEALGVTFAAQVGVAPILVPMTGGLPVASILANPLAVPVAGLITTWGLPAGVVAGLGGPTVASLVHLPTVAMITWVAAVARLAATLPLGALGWTHLGVLGASFALARAAPAARPIAGALLVLALAAPGIALTRAPPDQDLGPGLSVHRGGGATVVVVDARPRALRVLTELRQVGVRRVDVLVATGAAGDDLATAIRHRWHLGRVVDPQQDAGLVLRVGSLTLAVGGEGQVALTRAPAGSGPRSGR